MADKRSRYFALVTYITDTDRVIDKIQTKRNSIRAFALIKHDKDETDPHHHIVMRTHNALTCSTVVKWFKDTEKGQNTFAEFVHDTGAVLDYLTHENEADKYHYDKTAVIDGGLCDLLPREDTADESMTILEDVLAGTPTRELCKKYGREYIYRAAAYMAVADQIKREEI